MANEECQEVKHIYTNILGKHEVFFIFICVNFDLNLRPVSEVKIKLACSIVEEFPFLKDEEGLGYVC